MSVTPRRGATRVSKLGILLAVALVLHGVETLFPSPFPFVRLGLTNVVTLFALLTMGFADALAVTLLRVVLASVIVGTFLGPTFALGAAGGIAAVLGMGLAARLALPPLGIVGLSMIGATCHNVAQIGAVALLYTGPGPAVRLLPAAFLLAAAAGLVTGFVALFALRRLAVPRQHGPRGVPYEWKGNRL